MFCASITLQTECHFEFLKYKDLWCKNIYMYSYSSKSSSIMDELWVSNPLQFWQNPQNPLASVSITWVNCPKFSVNKQVLVKTEFCHPWSKTYYYLFIINLDFRAVFSVTCSMCMCLDTRSSLWSGKNKWVWINNTCFQYAEILLDETLAQN